MADSDSLQPVILSLHSQYAALKNPSQETEKKTEEFLRTLLEAMGWKWLSDEVRPQSRVHGAGRTRRVDYKFAKAGHRPDFYLEAKKFSDNLDNPEHRKQVLEYGKNGGMRWVVLTNFLKWKVFNSDFYSEPEHALVFEFELIDVLADEEKMKWLLMFSHGMGGEALDEYAKKHHKWKESEDIEGLLTEHLNDIRNKLTKAIVEQNANLFSFDAEEDKTPDACVQHIIDRLIFCRMLEDSGADPERRMRDCFEQRDGRREFYGEYLCDFWEKKMLKRYDSSIFDKHRVDGLAISNDVFVPVFESFYVNPKTKLRYRFDAIGTDILGHSYENYLSFKVKQTAKRAGVVEEKYKRKQSGIYYTPKFLVDFLVRNTLGKRLAACKAPAEALKIKVLDPSCGSGTFLVRAFEEFRAWHETSNGWHEEGGGLQEFLDSVLENCIYGIDLDPRAVQLARLNLFIRVIGTPKTLPKLNVIDRNSLVWEEGIPKRMQYERDFPLVHENGGFDVILGNPPWEKWKPDSQEFFETYYEGFKSLPTQEAKRKMEEIIKAKKGVGHLWKQELDRYRLYSDIFRENFKFQSADVEGRKASGDLDLYKLFVERAYMLLKEGGVAGLVVPSGIYTDLGAKGLRGMLFDKCKLEFLYSFENRGHAIFPDVHASYKPILVAYAKGGKTASFPCAFFLHTNEDLLAAEKNPTVLPVDFVKKSSPTSWSVLEIKMPKDREIVEKLLKFPPLGKEIEGEWNIEMQSGFHMTNDSHLFQTGKLGVPMLEGKNIYQFQHLWKESPSPRYTIKEEDIRANLKPDKIYNKNYWMAYRLIARSNDHRTFISAVVPPGYVCGNSIAIIRLPTLKQLCFLCGVMNSFVIDYLLRQKVSANINMFYFLETPIPRISSGKDFDEIARKTAQLVATTDEFSELKKELGMNNPVSSDADRMKVRAQIDAMVAKLYGITKDELEYVLTKFPNADERQKKLVLEEY